MHFLINGVGVPLKLHTSSYCALLDLESEVHNFHTVSFVHF